MKKISTSILLAIVFLVSSSTFAQTKDINNLDALLIQGDYNEVVAKCTELVKNDSLNPELYHKLGLAYQNLMQTDKSIGALSKAIILSPDTKKYKFSLAKYYYNLARLHMAQPLFSDLCKQDSTNWLFTYYLTEIFMQRKMYESAFPFYKQFYKSDTTNSNYIDKYAFCNLKMERFDSAIMLYEKSFKLNNKNIAALKNLSYLYLQKDMVDTAIYQLTLGLTIDSTDYDLYKRRADIYFSQNLHFKAGSDYNKVLFYGDSTKIVLKRMGIGLLFNQQNVEALTYFKAAFIKDSGDFEIPSYLGQTYYNLKQYKKSIRFYNKVLDILAIYVKQSDYTNVLIADSYKDSSLYNQAITHYTKSFNNKYSARICMTLANIYDKELKDYDKAIYYYQLFINNPGKGEVVLFPGYIQNVQKRLDFLIEQKKKKVSKT